MSEVIHLNEGASIIWGNRADARAVMSLWKTGLEDAPAHLRPSDQVRFAQAWLTAQAIKVDLLCFLDELWTAVWRGHAGDGRVATMREFVDAGFNSTSLEEWAIDGDEEAAFAHAFYGVLTWPTGRMMECVVGMTSDGALGMWAQTADAGRFRGRIVKAGLGWSLGDQEEEYVYAYDLGTISENKLDVSRARQCASLLLEAWSKAR